MLKILGHWLKKIVSDVHSTIVSIIVLAVLSFGGIAAFSKNLQQFLFDTLQTATPLWLTILLVLLACVLTYLVMRKTQSSKSPNINDYEFIENPGYYSHKKHGGRYCHPCLLSGIASPLSKFDSFYLRCYKCDTEIRSKPIIDD
jgi:hypothetical protein